MARQRTVLSFALATFVLFFLFFLGVRTYLVCSGNVPGASTFSEVLPGFLEDLGLAAGLSLLALIALSLGKAPYLLLVWPLQALIVLFSYANLQYVNFFGENVGLFDLEYVRNLGSVWKFSLKHIWIRRGEPLFLVLPLLALLAGLIGLLLTKIRRASLARGLVFGSALLGVSLLAFWGADALSGRENLRGFQQNNFFVEMVKGIPRLRDFVRARREIKNLKIDLAEPGPNPSRPEAPDRFKPPSSGHWVLRKRPVPLPEGYVWYDKNFPFIKVPRPDAVRMGLLAGAQPATGAPPPEASRPRRNVVFIFMESFRAKEIGLFGSPYHLTPHFDALAGKGVLFKNFYGHSDLTAGAEFSTVCSFYEVFKGVDAMRSHAEASLFSLPEILELFGYTNYWINSWSADFDNSRDFFGRHGRFRIVDKAAFPSDAEKAGGHYDDEEIAKMAAQTLEAAPQPFFAMILTATNHMPYRIPDGKFRLGLEPGLFGRYLETFHYSDYALGRFFDLVRDKGFFKNTLFFIFADTGDNRSLKALKTVPEYFENAYHIPFLIYDPAAEAGRAVEDIGGQVDIVPTALDMLGIRIANPFVGQSLLQPRTSPSYLCYHGRDNPSVFWVDQSRLYSYSLESERFQAFERTSGQKVEVEPAERERVISRIKEFVVLGDWSFANDRIWDPKLDVFYRNLFRKE
jgi:hypothetical protein